MHETKKVQALEVLTKLVDAETQLSVIEAEKFASEIAAEPPSTYQRRFLRVYNMLQTLLEAERAMPESKSLYDINARLHTVRALVSHAARRLLDDTTSPRLQRDLRDAIAAENAVLVELKGIL